MKKIFFKKCFVIIILIVFLLPSQAFAQVSESEAREVVVSYATNFAKSKYVDLVNYYCPGDYSYRNRVYENGIDSDASYINGFMQLDCVGWTNILIHFSTGLDCGASGSNSMCFAAPGGSNNRTYFDYHSGTGYQPGDLIVSSTHIMCYVGDGTDYNGKSVSDLIIHSASSNHLTVNSLAESGYGGQILGYYTFNSKALAEMDKANFNYNGSSVSLKNSAQKNNNAMSNFYYNGIPDGKYSVTKSFFSVLIESLGQIMDWIIGLLTMMVRMVFVGWAAIIEWVINTAVKGLTGGGNMNSVPVTGTEIQSGDNITIEKILFNKIGIFDVNFFNFNDEDPNLNP